MRNVLTLTTICLLMNCTQRPISGTSTVKLTGNPPGTPMMAKTKTLDIIVNDVSGSNPWLLLEKRNVRELLLRDSLQPGTVQLAGILINEQGMDQTPYFSEEITLDLRSTDGDIFEETDAKVFNQQSLVQYKHLCEAATDSFAKYILQPRAADFSDVQGALMLARKITNLAVYRDYNIRLIILSDMRQDKPGNPSLGEIVLPCNTTVYVIGQVESLNLKQVFPKNTVIELPSFEAKFFNQS